LCLAASRCNIAFFHTVPQNFFLDKSNQHSDVEKENSERKKEQQLTIQKQEEEEEGHECHRTVFIVSK
jgi:hypothetical protein